jgi:hypothetical protein
MKSLEKGKKMKELKGQAKQLPTIFLVLSYIADFLSMMEFYYLSFAQIVYFNIKYFHSLLIYNIFLGFKYFDYFAIANLFFTLFYLIYYTIQEFSSDHCL